MDTGSSSGLLGFWVQADAVVRITALLLLAMSVLTWYLIFSKGLQIWAVRRQSERAVDEFWNAENINEAAAHMQQRAPDSPFTVVALDGLSAHTHHARHVGGKLAESLDLSEFLTRAIRRAIGRVTARLDAGLTILASIGATAPFVGLFGTVWGIYHALLGISLSGQSTIDKVAGPVGEALVMTAFGIAVAVPAVLAYNTLTRSNRNTLAELDAFAHDLHAYLTTGARVSMNEAAPDASGSRKKPRAGTA
jgi:biopolymer transport protein ExbB